MGPNMMRLAVILAIVLAGLLFVQASYYTIESGTVGVLATFGKYSADVKRPGLHFKMPLMQVLHVVDVKLRTANYVGTQDRPDKEGVQNKPSIQVLDNKNLPIGIEMSVQYQPSIDQANLLLEHYGSNYFDKLINPLVRDVVRNVIGQYQAEEIAEKRSEIGTEINRQLEGKFAGLPFTLRAVALRNINLPPIVLKKIEEVQLAKQEEQRLGMVQKQASKEQEIKTIQAKTRLIEVTTQATADADKKRIEADAKAYQIQKEAEAEAAANKLIASSISADLIHYRAIDRWDGQYPRMLLSGEGGGGLILSLPDLAGQAKVATQPGH